MRMHVQDAYDAAVHPVVLRRKDLLETEYRTKWNEAYYSVNSKLLKKTRRLLRLCDPELGQHWYK